MGKLRKNKIKPLCPQCGKQLKIDPRSFRGNLIYYCQHGILWYKKGARCTYFNKKLDVTKDQVYKYDKKLDEFCTLHKIGEKK